MAMIMSQGGPKQCDSCKRHSMLEFYTCRACPPQADSNSFDLCVFCCNNYAREAHQEHYGTGYSFAFTRRHRQCNWCSTPISGDFMMCEACPQDMNCYDLCLTCTMLREPMQLHETSPEHKRFRYVKWLPSDIPGSLTSPQVFRLNWTWYCDGAHPQGMNRVRGPFFHCLDCVDNGFDLCASCADKGGIFRHSRNNRHRFAYVSQVKPPVIPSVGNNEPPPPYRDDRFHGI